MDGRTLRTVIRRDRRNPAGASSAVELTVAQNQNPNFTLIASADPISVGQRVVLSVMLAAANNANQPVTLYGHENGSPYAAIASTMTDASGRYSFMQVPQHTTVYQVRTGEGRRTAQVFEAVRDVISPLTVALSNPTVGQVVSVTGPVAPDKTGHFIELQSSGQTATTTRSRPSG